MPEKDITTSMTAFNYNMQILNAFSEWISEYEQSTNVTFSDESKRVVIDQMVDIINNYFPDDNGNIEEFKKALVKCLAVMIAQKLDYLKLLQK